MRIRKLALWGTALILILVVIATGLLLRLDLDEHREWVAEQATVAIGRRVVIEGPMTWTLSLTPTIVVRGVRIENPPWASRPDFVRAENVELTIALLPLLRGLIAIPRVVIEGIDVLLEEGPSGQTNWAFTHQPSSRAAAGGTRVTNILDEIRMIELRRGTLVHSADGAHRLERALVAEAKLQAAPGQPLRITIAGEFQQVPVVIHANGGDLATLMATSGSWPLAAEVQAGDASLSVEGHIGMPIGMPTFDFQVKLAGERLSALNPLLAGEWPTLGPYRLSGLVRAINGTVALTDFRGQLGSSDLAGSVSLNHREQRTSVAVSLISQRIDLADFQDRHRTSEARSAAAFQDQGSGVIDFLKRWDATVEVKAETFVVGDLEFQTLECRTTLQNGLLRIEQLRGRLFGSPLDGHGELNAGSGLPSASLALAAENFDYGLALTSLGAYDGVVGISDMTFHATAKGTTWQDIVASLIVTMRMDQGKFLVHDPFSGRMTDLWIHDGQASLSGSEPGQVVLVGAYGIRPFRIELSVGPVARLLANQSWPARLSIRGASGHLTIGGLVREPLRGGGFALSISGEGQSLDTLTPLLPALGPYRVSAQVTGEIDRLKISHFSGRLDKSDVAGWIDLARKDGRVAMTARLVSRQIRAEHFVAHTRHSDPAGTSPPTQAREGLGLARSLRSFDANVEWAVKQLTSSSLGVNGLSLAMTLTGGQLAASWSAALDPGGELKAEFALDSSGDVSALKASARSQSLDYGRLLARFGLTRRVTGSAELEMSLTSQGHTLQDLVDHVIARLKTRPGVIQIAAGAGKDLERVMVAEATLEVQAERPLTLSVRGEVRDVPLSLTATTMPLGQLFKAQEQWPLTLVVQGPDTALEAVGNVGRRLQRGSYDFRVNLRGSTLKSMAPLLRVELPDLGPYELSGNLAVQGRQMTLSNFHGRVAANSITGKVGLSLRGPRPRLTGTFLSESIHLSHKESKSPATGMIQASDTPLSETMVKKAKEAGSALKSTGEMAAEVFDPLDRKSSGSAGERALLIPAKVIPIQTLRASDMDLSWTIKRLVVPPLDLGELKAAIKIETGVLMMDLVVAPPAGDATSAFLIVDAARARPYIQTQISVRNLDYGGLLRAVGITDLIQGKVDWTLALDGDGTSLREVLAHANGRLEIEAGSAKLPTRYLDLWAANLMTAMLSEAWQKQNTTQYDCGIAYFGIRNGEVQTDALLVHGPHHTLAAIGTLTMGTEEIDLVVTPKPKDLALLSLAVPVRVTGTLAKPHVSTNVNSIITSKAWQALDITDPIDVVLHVPSVVATQVGRGQPGDPLHVNPCAAALGKEGQSRLSIEKEVRGGFDWIRGLWRDLKNGTAHIFGAQHSEPATK